MRHPRLLRELRGAGGRLRPRGPGRLRCWHRPSGPWSTSSSRPAVRASVAGWLLVAGVLGAVGGLVAFGAVADLGNRFSLAAVVLFLPAALAAGLFWCVPETRGREPEDLWPDG